MSSLPKFFAYINAVSDDELLLALLHPANHDLSPNEFGQRNSAKKVVELNFHILTFQSLDSCW